MSDDKKMNATSRSPEDDNSVPAESDDDFNYEEVSLEDDWSLTEGEEDLEATVKAIIDRAEASAAATGIRTSTNNNTRRAESVDDFLRNFLSQMGMTGTLDCFQAEWTEMVHKGILDKERVGVVPDVYTDNNRLDSELKHALREGEEYKLAVSSAAETLARVQKARDHHRMRHKRVVQEKNRLIEEMRKLKVQCNSKEPAVKRMNEKYQTVSKQTMQLTLERDKVSGQTKPFCGDSSGGGGPVNWTGESNVKGTTPPGIQPRPPTSPHVPRSQSRVSFSEDTCFLK